MSKNQASAIWHGNLKEGEGFSTLSTSGNTFPYTFSSRFENGKGTNPEELVAAAHAACFSMALSNIIAKNGYHSISVATQAIATLSDPGDGFRITHMELSTKGKVEGIDQETFMNLAEEAKEGCPISKTLSSVNITLKAILI